jgi:hypothetical protein
MVVEQAERGTAEDVGVKPLLSVLVLEGLGPAAMRGIQYARHIVQVTNPSVEGSLPHHDLPPPGKASDLGVVCLLHVGVLLFDEAREAGPFRLQDLL